MDEFEYFRKAELRVVEWLEAHDMNCCKAFLACREANRSESSGSDRLRKLKSALAIPMKAAGIADRFVLSDEPVYSHELVFFKYLFVVGALEALAWQPERVRAELTSNAVKARIVELAKEFLTFWKGL